MSKSPTITSEEKTSLFTPRFLIALVLIVAGIAWLVFYYVQGRGNPLAFPPVDGSPKAVSDLGLWNYAIGFGLVMVGLMISAHPATPLGRGRGVRHPRRAERRRSVQRPYAHRSRTPISGARPPTTPARWKAGYAPSCPARTPATSSTASPIEP